MNVDSVKIDNSAYSPKANSATSGKTAVNVSTTVASSNKGDRLELSSNVKNYQKILEKIKSGEYDKPEVINKIANKLSDLLK